jgi:hypothetical protein
MGLWRSPLSCNWSYHQVEHKSRSPTRPSRVVSSLEIVIFPGGRTADAREAEALGGWLPNADHMRRQSHPEWLCGLFLLC